MACRRTAPYRLSEAQAQAILELRLQRLTGLERDKIGAELQELATTIKDYLEILGSRPRRLDILRTELREMKEQFGTPRRTEIDGSGVRAGHRGPDPARGHGRHRHPWRLYQARAAVEPIAPSAAAARAAPAWRPGTRISSPSSSWPNTHTPVAVLLHPGMVYKMKVYRLPLGTPQARGKALVNLLPLAEGETISTVMPLPEDEASWAQHVQSCSPPPAATSAATSCRDFVDVKANGKIAMKLEEGDRLIGVAACTENDDVLLATRRRQGDPLPGHRRARLPGRTSDRCARHQAGGGRRGHLDVDPAPCRGRHRRARRLSALRAEAPRLRRRRPAVESERRGGRRSCRDDVGRALSPSSRRKEEFILTVTAKRLSASAPRPMNTASPAAAGRASPTSRHRRAQRPRWSPPSRSAERDQIMLVTDGGQLIRCPVHDIRIARPQDPGRHPVQGAKATSASSRSPASATRRKAMGDGDEAAPEWLRQRQRERRRRERQQRRHWEDSHG